MDFAAWFNYGVPTAVLIALGFAVRHLAKWAGPKIDRLVETHVAFVDRVGAAVENQTNISKQQAETLASSLVLHKEHGVELGEVKELAKRIEQKLNG